MTRSVKREHLLKKTCQNCLYNKTGTFYYSFLAGKKMGQGHTFDSRLWILSKTLFWLSCCCPPICLTESRALRSSDESLAMDVSQRTIRPLRSVKEATWWTSKFFTAEFVPTAALSLTLSWSSRDYKISKKILIMIKALYSFNNSEIRSKL